MIDIKAIRAAADRAAHGLDHTDQIHWRVLIGPKEVLALCDEIERRDAVLRMAQSALGEACGDRCNAEYNPCYAREAIKAIQEVLG